MDVRQFDFLARQPSAAVKIRKSFLGMPKRGLAFLLANVMFWQPMWAQADGIVVANPNTSLDRAGNGVPIINIATPNGSGLSHNQFHDYNVGAQGVILNNGSTQTTTTQLGGHIIGNPNLKNSGSAQAILNEVISGNPSQLRGYTEVAGQSARVSVSSSTDRQQTSSSATASKAAASKTTITGKYKVDIRTENHTQLDGALIAADNGNLKLDTGTLGFSDIAGSDKEHGYYLNVGGSYTKGKGTGAQDASQTGKGKEGETGWSVSGWKYDKDREQIVRATVGAGDIVVRQDAETGKDSTVGLNRDVDKGFEITKDKESRTDLYVSKSSLEAVADPSGTLLAWANKIENYADATQGSFEAALSLITGPVNMVGQAWNNLQTQRVSLDEVPASAR